MHQNHEKKKKKGLGIKINKKKKWGEKLEKGGLRIKSGIRGKKKQKKGGSRH